MQKPKVLLLKYYATRKFERVYKTIINLKIFVPDLNKLAHPYLHHTALHPDHLEWPGDLQ